MLKEDVNVMIVKAIQIQFTFEPQGWLDVWLPFHLIIKLGVRRTLLPSPTNDKSWRFKIPAPFITSSILK